VFWQYRYRALHTALGCKCVCLLVLIPWSINARKVAVTVVIFIINPSISFIIAAGNFSIIMTEHVYSVFKLIWPFKDLPSSRFAKMKLVSYSQFSDSLSSSSHSLQSRLLFPAAAHPPSYRSPLHPVLFCSHNTVLQTFRIDYDPNNHWNTGSSSRHQECATQVSFISTMGRFSA